MAEQWEYKTLKYKLTGFTRKLDPEAFESELNQYGRDGWEIVSIFDTNYSEGGTKEIIVVFKRKKGY